MADLKGEAYETYIKKILRTEPRQYFCTFTFGKELRNMVVVCCKREDCGYNGDFGYCQCSKVDMDENGACTDYYRGDDRHDNSEEE